jgi:hypothetical protein
LPKFTGSTTIGDSAITDNGTTVTLVSRALSGTSATFSGNVIFDTNDRGIVSNTSDGSDNKFVSINGGGARGSDRGGGINLFGNEAAGTGRIDINAGDVTGGVINLVTAGLNRLTVARDGNVLIGTTDDAGFKLDVNGTGRFSGALSGTSATFSASLRSNGGDVRSIGTGSNTEGSGPWYLLGDTTGTNFFINQLNASNGLDWYYYNGSWSASLFKLASTGAATFANLAGSGTRMVTASSAGLLATAAIPTGILASGNMLIAGDGTTTDFYTGFDNGTVMVATASNSDSDELNYYVYQSGTQWRIQFTTAPPNAVNVRFYAIVI